jgi:hypothetical protein
MSSQVLEKGKEFVDWLKGSGVSCIWGSSFSNVTGFSRAAQGSTPSRKLGPWHVKKPACQMPVLYVLNQFFSLRVCRPDGCLKWMKVMFSDVCL